MFSSLSIISNKNNNVPSPRQFKEHHSNNNNNEESHPFNDESQQIQYIDCDDKAEILTCATNSANSLIPANYPASSSSPLSMDILKSSESITATLERNFTVMIRRISFDWSSIKVDELVASDHKPVRRRSIDAKLKTTSDTSMILTENSLTIRPTEDDLVVVRDKDVMIENIPTATDSIFEGEDYILANHIFHIEKLPITQSCMKMLTIGQFSNVEYIAYGSNSQILKGNYNCSVENNLSVCIKILKENVIYNQTAILEFEVERNLLMRINHPHIIKIIGHGSVPATFMVLEWLEGGTLASKFETPRKRKSFTDVWFSKPEGHLNEILRLAIQLADALDYLHRRVHADAVIIHRDLKPENIGFSSNGDLKIFDFGLSICVQKCEEISNVYEMTGMTGSLRYMAPEVALEKCYNERVDVHSFGIILWQMASLEIPFRGFNRQDYMKYVVHQHMRPTIDQSWPIPLQHLLALCWHVDFTRRPSMEEILMELKMILTNINI